MSLNRLGRVAGFMLPILMVGALIVGCGDDDDGTGVTINDLAGTWDGTSVELTWNAIVYMRNRFSRSSQAGFKRDEAKTVMQLILKTLREDNWGQGTPGNLDQREVRT